MINIEFILQDSNYKTLRKVQAEAGAIPLVGDCLNFYETFDDPEKDGWFFLAEEITWNFKSGTISPTITCVPENSFDRLDILKRHKWIPK